MSLEGDFYERFARLVLSGETFESIEQSAAALIYLFHDVREGMLIEDCATLVHVSFDEVAATIRSYQRLLNPARAKC